MATPVDRTRRRLAPAVPSWRRLTVLVSLLLLGWAALLPPGRTPQWWHYAIGVALILAFLGSWHGQHVSTTVRRWAPMSAYNRRQRRRRVTSRGDTAPETPDAPARGSDILEARVVIHLRPHPHALTTPADTADQLPWRFITSWLDRYGVRADELTISALTRTPPPSGLRTDAAALLTGRTPQHRDTWLTYTLRAQSNVGALTARRTTMGHATADSTGIGAEDSSTPQQTALADTVARRLVAELREQGWLATLTDVDEVPTFAPASATVRREHWTATEHSDGFRAVYAVEPGQLARVLDALPSLASKATWVTMTVREPNSQSVTIDAAVGVVSSAKPGRNPLPGLAGFHGLHRKVAPALSVTGFDQSRFALPQGQLSWEDLTSLRWTTAAAGVPIGFNRNREPVYLGLASPEPVRVTVTGTGQFQVGIVSRLALSGLPVALYVTDPRPWASLGNHGAPQQFSVRPPALLPGSIVVTDGSVDAPSGAAITVTLRRPQSAQPPSTTVVITQDGARANLFQLITAHDRQWLSTRLVEAAPRR
ncbi:hypothetical protein QRB38_13420 [Mycobacterium avium subsp. hominissuis]|uniref:hypothetical protein n=1 Tax=Mycobacterium avium TaxID=1764 RepID=UPI00266614F7|nr:hypothetical protein [Mycobacterium avium]MDO2394811.1 hypothetical protein [Mycobacterium avium subsp. hominissuis]